MKKLFNLMLLLCLTTSLWAQKDTEFWFAAPEVSQHGSSWLDRNIVLRITTYGSPSNIIISQPAAGGMSTLTASIPANSTQSFDLTTWIDFIENKPANTVKNFGIKITATNPVSTYYEVVTGANGAAPANNPEAFILKGKNALGNNFYIPSQNLVGNHPSYNNPTPYNSFDIVATKNNTTVTITPTKNVVGHAAGVPYNITLQQGQTYSATATSQAANQHLEGSVVTSNEPIAITVKDDLLSGTLFSGACADLAGDQIIPVALLGTEYIAIKGQLSSPGDYLFVTATQNGTTINKDGVATPIATINAGQTYSFPIGTGASTYIQTSAPAYVWQLSGSGCELGATILPQIICTGSDSVSYVRSSNNQLYVNLLVPAGNQGNFFINGTAISSSPFVAVPGTSGAWVAASILLPLAQYPQGSVISVINTTSKFHLSAIDINGGGTSYAYFSDYGSLTAIATASPNPACLGDNIQLSANTQGGATYTWNGPGFGSSLQNPLITGATFGNAGLYTLTINQNGCQASATVNVSVIKCPKECIIEAGYTINFNNPYNLNFYANGNPAGGTFLWDFGDGSGVVPTAIGAIAHTYPGPGSYTVTITYITPQGEKCTKKVNICIARNDVQAGKETGTQSSSSEESFIGELFPNPANTYINIPVKQLDKHPDAKASIAVYTIEGKKVFSDVIAISGSMVKLPVKNLPMGTYLCEISYGNEKAVRKFVKL